MKDFMIELIIAKLRENREIQDLVYLLLSRLMFDVVKSRSIDKNTVEKSKSKSASKSNSKSGSRGNSRSGSK